MTTMELAAIRMQAAWMSPEPADRYQIRNAKGIVVAFDLTLERANEWARFYGGSTIEKTAK